MPDLSPPPLPELPAVLAALRERHPGDDLAPVEKAHAVLERRAAAGQSMLGLRAGLAAAASLAAMRLDPPAVAAILLAAAGLAPLSRGGGRDSSPAAATATSPKSELELEFGSEIARLVDGVGRLQSIRWDRIEEEAAETLRKMFLAMAADIRVVVVVLGLRVELMRALRASAGDGKPGSRAAAIPTPDERQRLARETLEVFAPLANRLGIWQLKWELEDAALAELEPQTYDELTRLLAEHQEERAAFIREVMALLRQKLAEAGIDAVVSGRPKHVYSIYKKMQRKEVSFDQIYDMSAVRIITSKVSDCYAALGMVHALWLPLPGEFDDYIARPKDNLYQSLHTAVVGPGGKPLEVQIRTHEMHQYAEFGVAAHWAYKERKGTRDMDKRFMLLRQLMDWEREATSPHQFVESLKTDIFRDQVYVFTPAGDVVDLPQGATPLDFAYRIHTMVGHRCRGARVRDQIVPLDYQLKTGDRVEILTQKKAQPSRDWMNPSFGYLRTASARTKVRAWFREQERDVSVAQGRELVERELKRLGLEHALAERVATRLGFPSVEDLYAAVGYGDRSHHGVGAAALELERHDAAEREPEVSLPPPTPTPSKVARASTSGVSFGGVGDILGNRARCCNPMPGDAVVGYISRGRGITIHRRDCPHVVDHSEPERLVDIDWGPGRGERYPVEVEIHAQSRKGLLRDLSDLVVQSGVSMIKARAEAHEKDGTAWLRLSLEFQDADQLSRLLQRFDQHRDVLEVRRLGR
ncbi:MAG: bifunctional (p)ppGpp synthetase/guanosine-3',5'-bis(diphosphate) 3'-pyrophosphohydrolase [Myxococcales bacterium]|nr:bifunctional (p)ppGpp synthetase/guanosine-3',5'-bis(diphosphate) 3'-pyrophosphohydrolase [Myxococcales bacterium]